MASGKSTVAAALANRFPRSVHLKGDAFRRFIVNGQAPLSLDLSEEGERQLILRYEIAAEAARRYLEAGFTVVYQDIILGKPLETVVSKFDGLPLTVIVLAPDAGTIAHREANRGKSGYKNTAEIARFDKVLREETPQIGTWIDSSAMTLRETVDQVVAAAGEE